MFIQLLLSLFCLVRIPLTLTEEGMPKIAVSVEGKELEAWVDLGRSIALIQEDQLPKGSLLPTGAIVNTQGFNDVVKKQDEVKISSVIISSYPFVDVKGTIGTNQIPTYLITSTKTTTQTNPYPPLMLGNQMFSQGVLLVDYKSGFFEYGKDISEFIKEVPFQRWAYIPFQLDRGQIQFLGLMRGLSGRWILDSGSTVNLLYKGFMGPLKFTQAEDQNLKLGNSSFVLENVYYSNKPLKTGIFGIAGAPFIKKYRILIDFKKKHLYIEP